MEDSEEILTQNIALTDVLVNVKEQLRAMEDRLKM